MARDVGRTRRGPWANLAIVTGAIAVSLLAAELILRVAGFTFHLYPERVEFGWPDPVTLEEKFEPDADLLWVRKGYQASLAKLRENPPAVLFMGCSCTQYGSYDVDFKELVDERHAGADLSIGNVGTGGWTTYQGLLQLQRDIIRIRPRVITLYYGWNDHWIGFGIEDADIGRMNRSPLYAGRGSRVVQLLSKAVVALGRGRREGQSLRRVPPEAFRENLREMVRIAREHDITPVLLTAPTSHIRGWEPTYLEGRWLEDLDELVPLHQQYVSLVRQVAREEDVILADLAAVFERLPRAQVADVYFRRDGIHLQEAGDRKIAEILYETFQRHGLLDEILR